MIEKTPIYMEDSRRDNVSCYTIMNYAYLHIILYINSNYVGDSTNSIYHNELDQVTPYRCQMSSGCHLDNSLLDNELCVQVTLVTVVTALHVQSTIYDFLYITRGPFDVTSVTRASNSL